MEEIIAIVTTLSVSCCGLKTRLHLVLSLRQKNLFKLQLYWNHIRHGCSPVNLLHIFRTPFPKNTSGGLLLSLSPQVIVLKHALSNIDRFWTTKLSLTSETSYSITTYINNTNNVLICESYHFFFPKFVHVWIAKTVMDKMNLKVIWKHWCCHFLNWID